MTAEVALAVVLLTAAALFIASFVTVVRVEPGFDYRDTLVVNSFIRSNPAADTSGDAWSERGHARFAAVLDAVRRAPGVTSVGAVYGGLPLTGGYSRVSLTLPGRDQIRGNSPLAIDLRRITSNYFDLLSMRVIAGRALTDPRGDPVG